MYRHRQPPSPIDRYHLLISTTYGYANLPYTMFSSMSSHSPKLTLHEALTCKNGPIIDLELFGESFVDEMPTTMIGVAGTPKLKSYDIDFGWGKPKKVETISIDFSKSISMNACKESSNDLEIGVVLPAKEMEIFVRTFQDASQSMEMDENAAEVDFGMPRLTLPSSIGKGLDYISKFMTSRLSGDLENAKLLLDYLVALNHHAEVIVVHTPIMHEIIV
nr:malonyl-coenzyme A:anthocyanin 3-O-glucoside-6''-O-malonyltransferase-like [Tanacetum cinerariifolium]